MSLFPWFCLVPLLADRKRDNKDWHHAVLARRETGKKMHNVGNKNFPVILPIY
jgi:hypothetical protein